MAKWDGAAKNNELNNALMDEYEEEELVEEDLDPQNGDEELAEPQSDDQEEYSESEEGGGGHGEGGAQDYAMVGIYSPDEVNDQIFEELHLENDVIREMRIVWESFLRACGSKDAAGEALHQATYDASPSMQHLFTLPRGVFAMRFLGALNSVINTLHEPAALKTMIETLGFQHLQIEVTAPRAAIFRDAIIDLFIVELGATVSIKAQQGWRTLVNYAGGSYIYIKSKFTERLKILSQSWAIANGRRLDENGEEMTGEAAEASGSGAGEGDDPAVKDKNSDVKMRSKGMSAGNQGGGGGLFASRKAKKDTVNESQSSSGENKDMASEGMAAGAVPQTFREMFLFNAVVMGLSENAWFREVLDSFDSIVRYVSSTGRLQEECDIVSLRISKHTGKVNLAEFKAVMLASLRSLVPKDWDSQHEIAWSWLWENVERLIRNNLGKPGPQERALTKFLFDLEETRKTSMRYEIYSRLFTNAPQAEQFFKASTTRLHFICDKIVAMTLDMFRDPNKMVESISAIGLRHVGYGVPPEIFGPFVTSFCSVVCSFTDDEIAKDAFRWSLGLISRITTRVITEGSTIVMKAINQNSAIQLRKAVACAPRGKRSMWILRVQAGTQSISPLLWAIESSAMETAEAMLIDLLTIRADRERYYFGMDMLFERHPDIVKRLVQMAPGLLPTLFDGLIWRARSMEGGMRRVNYYIRHLVIDQNGQFAKAIEWICQTEDPKIVCHPLVAIVTDIVWGRIAFWSFLLRKMWLVFTLFIFVLGVAAFDPDKSSQAERIVVAGCRLFTYMASLVPRVYSHVARAFRDYKNRDFIRASRCPIPRYLSKWHDKVCLMLALVLLAMMVTEPVMACLADFDSELPLLTQACPTSESIRYPYSVLTLIATFLYFLQIVDLAVFSTNVSAFVLICFRVVNEALLYIFAIFFVILAFSCGIPSLIHNDPNFKTIPQSAYSLMNIALLMFDVERYEAIQQEPALTMAVVVYMIIASTFFVNLLVAQLSCAYQLVFQDMVGYARLNRGKIVTESMTNVNKQRWDVFVASLHLDEPCKFGEGDMGMPGGVQVLEPANQSLVSVDMIKRFGGTTSPQAQWPDEEEKDVENDRFGHLERLLDKAIRRLPATNSRKKMGSQSVTGSVVGGGSSSQDEDGRSIASEGMSE